MIKGLYYRVFLENRFKLYVSEFYLPVMKKLNSAGFVSSSKFSSEEILNLSNPFLIVASNSKVQNLFSSVQDESDHGLLTLASRPSLKTDKKLKKNEKDDDKESDRVGTKLKTKKKIRSKLTLEEDYESVDFNIDAEELVEDTTLLPLARPPRPESILPPNPIFTVKQKLAGTTLSKKKKVNGSIGKKDNEALSQEKPSEVTLTKSVTVEGLSDLFLVPKTEIIKFLFLKGITVTMNQMIDVKIAELVGGEFGIKVVGIKDFSNEIKKFDLSPDTMGVVKSRPPIVTIMGHVDHGKTTLLDKIRNTQVARKEAGGITQKIGAYEVEIDYKHEKKRIVFLDTPGHEAFSGMRSRGVSITDLVILVVAADDGIKQQTIEAIRYIQSAKVPLIVAINKIDKEDANLNFIQEELTKYNIVSEDWGGDTLVVPISATQGTNLETLLEMIILLSDVLDLRANPDSLAQGTVIESYLDRAKGAVATVIVQNGTLKVGDIITIGPILAKVRGMVNSSGVNIKEADPSSPVLIWGLPKIPSIGDQFRCFKEEKDARSLASSFTEGQKPSFASFQNLQEAYGSLDVDAKEKINLIIKTDTQGSAEAIISSISKFYDPRVQLKILYACAGEVTETDIEFAYTSSATLLAFNTTLASGAKKTAKNVAVVVKEFDVIYDLFDYVQSLVDSLIGPQYEEKLVGTVIVKTVFPLAKSYVAGSLVLEGKVTKSSMIQVLRNSETLYKGNITSLKRMKDDVSEVLQDSECGIFVSEFDSWKQGDSIQVFELIPKKKTTL